jgi:hypothetical protein
MVRRARKNNLNILFCLSCIRYIYTELSVSYTLHSGLRYSVDALCDEIRDKIRIKET